MVPDISINSDIIFIVGPTASGKSDFALSLAEKNHGIIINADALQIYRDFSIITARPDTSLTSVPHHLYGFLPIDGTYNVADWCRDVCKVISENLIQKIFVVGGTGMYFNALLKGIAQIPDIPNDIRTQARSFSNQEIYDYLQAHDKIAAEKLHINDTQRIARAFEVHKFTGKSIYQFQQETKPFLDSKYSTQGFYLKPERDILYERINQRFAKMIADGAIEEVKKVMHHNKNLQAMKAVGVPELISYLKQEISLESTIDKAKQASRNYAKRQMTFFNNQFPEFQTI